MSTMVEKLALGSGMTLPVKRGEEPCFAAPTPLSCEPATRDRRPMLSSVNTVTLHGFGNSLAVTPSSLLILREVLANRAICCR